MQDSSIKMEKLFIGPKEIKEVSPIYSEEYNNAQIELVDVTYVDGTKEKMTKAMYDISTTDKVSDWTKLLQQRGLVIIKEILALLLRWGVKVEEVNFFTNSVIQSINQSIQTAESKLWTKDVHTINLMDVDKVLKTKVTLDDVLRT